MAPKEGNFRRTEAITSFGYFETDNLIQLDSFGELEKKLNVSESSYLSEIRRLSELSASHIPILLSIPLRPVLEISPEEVEMSVAEIAGLAAAVEILLARPVVFFNRPNGFESPSGYWAHEYFKMTHVRPKNLAFTLNSREATISHITAEELLQRFNIKIDSTPSMTSLNLGGTNLVIENGSKIHTNGEEIKRIDLHALVGFLRTIYLHSVLRSSMTPDIQLIDFPLRPYSDLDGVCSIEQLIRLDRIKAYY